MSQVESLLIETGSEVVYETISELVEKSKVALLTDIRSFDQGALVDILAGLAGGFYTTLTLTLLKRFLKIEDSGTKIQRMLSQLVAAPMLTATSQVAVAMRLEPMAGRSESRSDSDFRIERYKNALVSFDQARSLANISEKPLIDLWSGMVCSRIPGASGEAFIHINDYLRAMGQIYLPLSKEWYSLALKWNAGKRAEQQKTYDKEYFTGTFSQAMFLNETNSKKIDALALRVAKMRAAVAYARNLNQHRLS